MTGALQKLSVGMMCAFAAAAPARSAPPLLSGIDPPAAQRGQEAQLRLVGTGLADTIAVVLPFKAETRVTGRSAAQVSCLVKPDPDTPPGVYPVRVHTAEGISNLRLLFVTDVPVVRVKEQDLDKANSRYKNGRLDFDQVQHINYPVVVAGGRRELAYRFTASSGQRLVFETLNWRAGLTPEPMLRLWNSQGRRLAEQHDTPGLHMDERLDFTFPAAGDYFVELQDFRVAGWNNHTLLKIGPANYARAVFPLGGRRGEKLRLQIVDSDGKSSSLEARVPDDPWIDHWYLPLKEHPGSLPWRLACGDRPEVMEEESRSEPQRLAWPTTVNGRIRQPDEEDLYRLAVEPGQHVRVQVEAYFLGSPLDGHLMVYDPIGQKLLAKNDDQVGRGNPDPGLTFEVPKGVREVIVSLRDISGSGGVEYGYRLTVERGGPDFFLWLGMAQNAHFINEEGKGYFRQDANDTLNLPIGGEAKLRISAMRTPKEDDPYYKGPLQGYQGAIHLKALNLPPGVTIAPAIIAAGQKQVEMVCRASSEAPRTPFEIVIVGEATREDGSVIRRVAERKLFTSHPQFIASAWNWRAQKLACVTTAKTPSIPIAK